MQPARLASVVGTPGAIVSIFDRTYDGREVGMPEHDETDAASTTEELVAETLVEEVFIDGMCGVY